MTRVFLLAGQSNMVGAGVTAELPPALRSTPANVRLFEDSNWRDLLGSESFGPEIGFALEIFTVFPEDRIVLCKVARGGANLHYDWNPDGFTRGSEDAYRGPLYPRLVSAFRELALSLEKDGEIVVPAATLWMQGERDSVFDFMARAYEANLHRFIEAVRGDTGAPVFLLGLIAPRVYRLEEGRFNHPFRRVVQEAQRRAAADPRVGLVETEDLPQSDNLHFDAAGQIELGRRFARAYLDIQENAG